MSFGARKATPPPRDASDRPHTPLRRPAQTKKSAAMADAQLEHSRSSSNGKLATIESAAFAAIVGPKRNKSFSRTNDMQSLVDKMTATDRVIDMPPPAPFLLPESDADGWSVPIMMKYVKDKMELPEYVGEFKRAEIDGLRFIGMDENHHCGIQMNHDFHALKIGSHAQSLRDQVLERAAIDRPESTADWTPAHIAAWLFYDQSCSETPVHSLRALLDGEKLKTLGSGKAAVVDMQALDLEEADNAIVALDGLLDRINSDLLTHKPTDRIWGIDTAIDKDIENKQSATAEVDVNKKLKPKKVKSKTAIQRRREQEARDEESATAAATAIAAAAELLEQPPAEELSAQAQATLPSAAPSIKVNDLPAIEEEPSYNSSPVKNVAVVVQSPSQQQQQQFVTGDDYTASRDREQFLHKISELRGVVEQHAKSMQQLREEALLLKRENERIHSQQKELIAEGSNSQQLVASLVQDRDLALRELSKVSSFYAAHAAREQQQVQQQLESLAVDSLHQQQENLHMANHLLSNSKTQIPLGPPSIDAPMAPSSTSIISLLNSQNSTDFNKSVDMRTSAGSALSAAREISSKSQSATAVVGDDNDSDLEDGFDQRLISQKNNFPTAVEYPPPVSYENPVAVATTLLLSASRGTTDGSRQQSPAVAEMDLLQMVNETAAQEFQLWERIITHYRLPTATSTATAAAVTASKVVVAENIADDKLLLHKIAVQWLRVGRQLLHDAHDSSLEKPWRKALRGLQKCAERATSPQQRQQDADKHTAKVGSFKRRSAAERAAATASTSSAAANSIAAAEVRMTAFDPTIIAAAVGEKDENSSLQHQFAASKQQQQQQQHSPHCDCFPYRTAVAMFFGLGLVQKLLNRHQEKDDKTQLVFLLNRIKYGELPLTELSRENLRDFLDFHLGVDLSWERFDSVCQRFDPDRNGFVSSSAVLRAFELLSPLADRLPPAQAQFHALFLLAICTDTLSQPRLPMAQTLAALLEFNAQSSPSFAKFISQERQRIATAATTSAATSSLLFQKLPQQDQKIAEEQLFASDVLFELSKEFVFRSESTSKLTHMQRSALPAQQRQQLQQRKVHYGDERRHFTFLLQQHQQCCSAVSRSLNLYDGERSELVPHLATLFLAVLKLRRCAVQQLLLQAREEEQQLQSAYRIALSSATETTTATKTSAADEAQLWQHGTSTLLPFSDWAQQQQQQKGKRSALSVEQLEKLLSSIDRNLETLQGKSAAAPETDLSDDEDPNSSNRQRYRTQQQQQQQQKTEDVATAVAADVNPQQLEFVLSELLGIAVPHCGPHSTAGALVEDRRSLSAAAAAASTNRNNSSSGCSIVHQALLLTQMQVETALLRAQEYHEAVHAAINSSSHSNSHSNSSKLLANAQALKEVQQQVHDSLWGVTSPQQQQLLSMSAPALAAPSPPFKVTAEVEKLMQQQRVELASRFVEFLNHKATRKKKILQSLFNLWESTKFAIAEGNKISVFGTEDDIESRRMAMMPESEILKQTRSIQQLIAVDMQRPFDTKTTQLAERVNQFKQQLQEQKQEQQQQNVALNDELREIESLERGLLQANQDAMRLASRIIKQLTGKTTADAVAAVTSATSSPRRQQQQKKRPQQQQQQRFASSGTIFGQRAQSPEIPMGYRLPKLP